MQMYGSIIKLLGFSVILMFSFSCENDIEVNEGEISISLLTFGRAKEEVKATPFP